MKSTDEAVAQWNLASKTQITQSTIVLTQTNKTLAQLQQLASNMDASLSTLSAQSAQAIAQQNQSLLLTQEELRKSLIEMNAATSQLTITLAESQRILTDPSIPASLANMQDSLKQVDASATDVRQIADKARETYLKHANLWLALARGLISAGG